MLELDWTLPYNPDKITNRQLVDDWRLFVAAIANLDDGIDEPYTETEIYVMAITCAKEIAKRVHAGNMAFSIAKDRGNAYEKLITKIKNKLELWELSTLFGSMDSSTLSDPKKKDFQLELIRDSKHRRGKCMECNAKPEYEVLWVEGMARAWFCEKHLNAWMKEQSEECLKEGFPNLDCSVDAIKRVENGEVGKLWKENKNPDILNQILHEIKPQIDLKLLNKEKQKERTTENEVRSKAVQDEEELAPVNPSGVELGEEITLEKLKKYFKSFYRTRPYVTIIGGICNWGKTKGDIEFFINALQRDIPTEFRIIRMFPKNYWSRFKFIYPDEKHPGKFTNHLDIFNEKIEAIPSPELVLMSSPKKVELFKFALLLKPTHGHYKGEEYSIDKLIEVVNAKPEWYERGIYIQKKFDGVHVRVDHSKDGKVIIWSEEGNRITKNLPQLTSEIRLACESHDVILVGELEFWQDKKHQSRQQTTAIIHTREVHPDEKDVILNAFDCLFFDRDVHDEVYSERLKILDKLSQTKHIQRAPFTLVHSPTELKKAVEHYADLSGSEGAYLKRADFKYELDGKTQLNLKYKNTYSIDAEVKEIHSVKGSETWNYLCSIKDGNRDVPIGRTYNTSIKLNTGDIVKVEFVNLNKYFDDRIRKKWYSWWSPRVIMAREDKKLPDTTATADKLVEASHGETRNRRAKVALDADPYMTLPDENTKLLGMCHIHGYGKSVHADLRFQVTSDYGVKWTLHIPKGLSKVAESFKEFKELVDKEIIPIVKNKLEDPRQKFNCGKAEPCPVKWLDFQGMVSKGGVGATKNEAGFFYIIDRFDVEFGAAKSHFHEYFCSGHGRLFKGRIVMTLLENKESWKRTGEGLMTWMCSAALTEKTPYVISSRAVKKKWAPPYNHSALPANLKSKVPKNNEYWTIRDPKNRLKKRDEFVAEIDRKQFELDSTGPASYKILRQTWKGQKVIREGASRTVYYFLICQDNVAKFGLAFQNNPLKNNELTGLAAKEKNKLCDIRKDENIKPGTALNLTQATPSKIIVLDVGSATILNTSNFKRYKIRTGRMKGTWQAYNREDGSVMWTLRKEA